MDILITSASRPKCLVREIESFIAATDHRIERNFYLHEDVVPGMEKESAQLVDWAVKSKVFSKIYVSNPRVGRGTALNKLRKHANSKYIWYMEEDFQFHYFIEMERLMNLMDKYTHINQIAFNWRVLPYIPKPGGPDTDVFCCEERRFEIPGGMSIREPQYITLHVSERWTWQPALWRRSWIMPKWNFNPRYSNKGFNRMLKEGIGEKEWDPVWHEQNVGAYYFGSWEDEPYVTHTSWDIRHDREFL